MFKPLSSFLTVTLGLCLLSSCGTAIEALNSAGVPTHTIASGDFGHQAVFATQAETLPVTQKTAAELSFRGINYYPQNTPWEAFWPQYDAQIIQTDLQRIQALGFDTVRIFVYYDDFGGAQVNTAMKAKLQNFLNQAQQQNLKVVVTLFDQYQDYQNLAAAQAHVKGLTQNLGAHPAIAAWDLKNESDRDRQAHGDEVINTWIYTLTETLHQLVNQPITASYARAENMGSEVEVLDYLTFHYYDDERQFGKTVDQLKAKFPNHPVVLGEFGYHTWEAHPSDPHPKAHQYNYFQAILAAAQTHQVQGIMAWSLYDYPVIENSTFLNTLSHEQNMGLLDLAGEKKAGYLAFEQSAAVVDAQTGTAVTPDTKEIEVVFNAPKADYTALMLVDMSQNQRSVRAFSIPTQKGLNTFRFKVNAEDLTHLLHLKYRLKIDTQNTVGLLPGIEHQALLTLRQD